VFVSTLTTSCDTCHATQIYVGEGKRDYVTMDKRIAVNGEKYIDLILCEAVSDSL
jgi:hypothetical protein